MSLQNITWRRPTSHGFSLLSCPWICPSWGFHIQFMYSLWPSVLTLHHVFRSHGMQQCFGFYDQIIFHPINMPCIVPWSLVDYIWVVLFVPKPMFQGPSRHVPRCIKVFSLEKLLPVFCSGFTDMEWSGWGWKHRVGWEQCLLHPVAWGRNKTCPPLLRAVCS